MQARKKAEAPVPSPDFLPGLTSGYPPLHWSKAVALDPKHRPQVPHRPSSTVRREWWRWPQEAHLVEARERRYRRLTVTEMARLQSFPEGWFDVEGVGDLDRIRAIGDAVPPLLAQAVVGAISDRLGLSGGTSAEICAGSGGLASASAGLGFRHELLVDYWPQSGQILSAGKPWGPDVVSVGDARQVEWSALADSIDLFSGGPPCQPWSTAGLHQGLDDERDLLGWVHEAIGTVRPQAFVFENVPGLLSEGNRQYFEWIMASLRNAAGPDSYGVAAGVLNAADFGVPQRRRRVFIIGIRGSASGRAYDVFDDIQKRMTHHDPAKPVIGARKPWRTVQDSLQEEVPEDAWREWPFGDV